MKQHKRPKFISDTIDILSEQDFNPDLVIPGLEDCYCRGMTTGGIIVFVSIVACEAVHKIVDFAKKHKKESSE